MVRTQISSLVVINISCGFHTINHEKMIEFELKCINSYHTR